MTDLHYRRGQVFGFTIAEAILLLFFSLLLLLASALMHSEKGAEEYKVDKLLRVEIQRTLEKYENDPRKLFIVIEEFREAAKEKLRSVERDGVAYEELRQLLLVIARERGIQGDETKVIPELLELLVAGERLRDARGINKTEQELAAMIISYEQAKRTGKDQSLQERLASLEKQLREEQKKFNQTSAENKYIKNELEKVNVKDGPRGFGFPPCWFGDRGRGMSVLTVGMFPEGFVLVPAVEFEAHTAQRFYSDLVLRKSDWGVVWRPSEFAELVKQYKSIGYSDASRKCDFWAEVVDCLPNDKDLYKVRISMVASGLKAFRKNDDEFCKKRVSGPLITPSLIGGRG